MTKRCPSGKVRRGNMCVKKSDSPDTWGRSGDITVGLYSPDTLRGVKSGRNKWAATVFMNRCSFSKDEIKSYPYASRRRYVAYLEDGDEPIIFYATDDKMAKKFLDSQYRTKDYPIISLKELKTKERSVI